MFLPDYDENKKNYCNYQTVGILYDGSVHPCCIFPSRISGRFDEKLESIFQEEKKEHNIFSPYCTLCHLRDETNYLKTIHINIGNECNARCLMCLGHKMNNNMLKEWTSGGLNAEKIFNRLDEISEKTNSFYQSIEVVGGEPLLHENTDMLCKLIDYASANKMKFSTITNGSIYNEKVLKKLNEKKYTLTVSVDGAKDNFEKIRFPLRYSTTINNIRKITQNYPNIRIAINYTLSVYNYNDVYSDIETIFKDTGISNIIINPVLDPFDVSIFSLSRENISIAFKQLNLVNQREECTRQCVKRINKLIFQKEIKYEKMV